MQAFMVSRMTSFRAAALALALLLAVTASLATSLQAQVLDHEGGQVVDLTADDFERRTQASTGQTAGVWFIEFYAPWCGHCQRLAPVWESLARELEGQVVVARVDCDSNKAIGRRFKASLDGFPTLVLFRDRAMYPYEGPRKLEALVAFAKGGYASASALPVPSEGSGLVESIRAQFDQLPALVKSAIMLLPVFIAIPILSRWIRAADQQDRAKTD
eukprot:jgi/Chlat1/1288/Chrsp118S01727